jgi:hypothetical protein
MTRAWERLHPLGLASQVYLSFHPRSVSPLARANYRRELVSAMFFPVALAAMEGGVVGVMVKSAYAGVVPDRALNYVVGLLVAAPEFANLTSFLWAAVGHGRRKVPLINALQALTILMVGAMALAPRTGGGLAVLAGAMVLGRIAFSGVLTLRTAVWRGNYSRGERARVTGKFAAIQVLMLAGAALALGLGKDAGETVVRGMMIGAGLIGAVGVAAYRGIRVRHERRVLRAERAGHEHERPGLSPLSLWRTLRADGDYARFMLAMFIFGLGNLLVSAPLVIILRDQFNLGGLASVAITTAIPCLVMPWAIPFWARLLTRHHAASFRARHGWAFVASQAMVLAGAAMHSLPMLYLAAAMQGVAGAGGAIAWNLGHLDFAPPHRVTEYMGIHVTLNGVRGLLAPLVSVSIYTWFDGRWPGHGYGVFGTSVAMCVAGVFMFRSLASRMDRRPGGVRRG